MLDISNNSVKHLVSLKDYKSYLMVGKAKYQMRIAKILLVLLGVLVGVSFLPWTQNIRARGAVTTLRPDHRPQALHSVIAGRIEKWYVKEGDFAKKGDTLLFISEVKDEYFDPQLLDRTSEQIKAKGFSRQSYEEKVDALRQQIDALEKVRKLKIQQNENKIEQARLKVVSDSIDLVAEKINRDIADHQLVRMEELYEKGLKSLTELEARRLKFQEAIAKYISSENKLLASRNELINAQLELTNTDNEYREKIAKAKSDLYASYSDMYNTESDLAKLENQYSNYEVRTGYYYVTAPQSGYVTQTVSKGIGEMIKEGTEILSVMPAEYDLAVEVFIRPVDLPLLEAGQKVRFVFDGWPFIVFSGWPELSIGAFGGKVVAIDNFSGPDGTFRVLVAPDENDKPWPKELKVGAGANAIALLKDVPIWYELWRNINGFPPEYYKPVNGNQAQKK